MPKWKESPNLFELVHRAQQQSVTAGVHEEDDDRPVEPAPAPPRVEGRGPMAEPDGEPSCRKDGGRVRFSLSTVALAVAIMSLAMVVLAAFFVGRQVGAAQARRSRSGDGVDQLIAVRHQLPRPEVVEDLELVSQEVLERQGRKRRAEAARRDGWITGLNYIWIDTFDSQEDAETARKFLLAEGVESKIVPVAGSNKQRLITVKGFDYPADKAACQDLEARIRKLGEGYLTQGGRYRFNCQVTKLTKDSW